MTSASLSRRQMLALASTTLASAGLALPSVSRSAGERLSGRPVRVIVPFPAGGSGDTSTRMVTEMLARKLGVPVVVDNKPGADSMIAVQELLRSAPDGHTIMFGTPSALLYTPQLTPRKPPYDPLKDLAPITHFSSFSYFVYVNDELPVKSMGELVEYVHKNPNKVAYGTGDSTQLVAMAQLCTQAKLAMIHVPYKGSSAAFLDFISNRIQVMIAGFELVEQSKGKARPLATLLTERSAVLPDVPALSESGLAPVTTKPWSAFFAPAKTPQPIIEQLNAAFTSTFQDPKLQEFFKSRGSILSASTPEAMHQILVDQMPVFAQAIKAFNLQRD